MKTIKHMNTNVTCFPAPNMVRIVCKSGPGERILQMFFSAIRKRKRIEYFKRQQRRKRKEER